MAELKFLFDALQPIMIIVVAIWLAVSIFSVVLRLMPGEKPKHESISLDEIIEKPKRNLIMLGDDGEIETIGRKP